MAAAYKTMVAKRWHKCMGKNCIVAGCGTATRVRFSPQSYGIWNVPTFVKLADEFPR